MVHKVNTWDAGRKKENTGNQACHRYGDLTHLAPQCKFWEAIRHQCGKKGHLKKVCRSSPSQQPTNPTSQQPPRKSRSRKKLQQPMCRLEDEEGASEEDFSLLNVHAVSERDTNMPPLEVATGWGSLICWRCHYFYKTSFET